MCSHHTAYVYSQQLAGVKYILYLISYFVAFYTNSTINWGMATALGGLLLLATMLLYVIYSWLVGASRLRLG